MMSWMKGPDIQRFARAVWTVTYNKRHLWYWFKNEPYTRDSGDVGGTTLLLEIFGKDDVLKRVSRFAVDECFNVNGLVVAATAHDLLEMLQQKGYAA